MHCPSSAIPHITIQAIANSSYVLCSSVNATLQDKTKKCAKALTDREAGACHVERWDSREALAPFLLLGARPSLKAQLPQTHRVYLHNSDQV